MKPNTLKQFVTLRNNLHAEKSRLEQRLKQINAALGIDSDEVPAPIHLQSAPAQTQRVTGGEIPLPKKRDGRSHGGVTLKEAVAQLTATKPLTKKEIVAGLKSTGYKTKSKNPGNLLNKLFYGKDAAFKNVGDGRYGPK